MLHILISDSLSWLEGKPLQCTPVFSRHRIAQSGPQACNWSKVSFCIDFLSLAARQHRRVA